MKIKHIEWTRHGLGEPLLAVDLYKKVEDGKVIGCFRLMYLRNGVITLYESDTFKGPEIVDIGPSSLNFIIKQLEKYFEDDRDDIVIRGEREIGEELLRLIENGSERRRETVS